MAQSWPWGSQIAVRKINHADPDKYKYSGYSIGFGLCLRFSWNDGSVVKNVIIVGIDNSSVHIDGRNKNILILGERPAQGLDHATITAEVKYPINFTESTKRFVLSLHYNRSNSFLIVDAAKIY